MIRAIGAMAVAWLSLLWAPAVDAATLEHVGNFDQPIFVSSDPADPDRLLVAEREGRVILVDESGPSLFAEIESLAACCNGERGLFSIAPAADFASSGRFYAAYAGETAAGGAEGDIHLDSFRPDGSGSTIREPILTIGHAALPTHNGGQLQFGPDGHLYLSTGDGGGVGDPFENAQDLSGLLGKILRIDPQPGQVPAYAIPSSNPFAGGPGEDEIWQYGLRNPWRFSFDRLSGDLVVADVGQGIREEVNHVASLAAGSVGGAGQNWGWNCREGLIAYPSAPPSCSGASGFADPVFDYPHSDPGDGGAFGCAITGGYVARDPDLADLYGRYVYADFCEGEIRSLALPGAGGGMASDDRSEGLTVPNPVSFGEDSGGRLYVVAQAGDVYRFVGDDPPEVDPPGSGSVPPPASVTAPRPPPAWIRLTARPAGKPPKVKFTVRVAPCAGYAGAAVSLNRGGHRFDDKRLNRSCVARFLLSVVDPSTYRAVVFPSGAGPLRSSRLTVAPRG